MYQIVSITLALLSALSSLYWSRKHTYKKPYPPGPRGKPIIGNALSIPSTHPWLYFAMLKKEYGDIIYFENLGQKTIILNSSQACQDLLFDRASKYSDRPRLVMFQEMMDWHRILPIMPYGPRWREGRKLMHAYMHKSSIRDHLPGIDKEAKLFLSRLLQWPEGRELSPEITLTVTKIILQSTYGIAVTSTRDELVGTVKAAFDIVIDATFPGRYYVDLLPALRYVPTWVPGARNFHKMARSGREAGWRMASVPYERVKQEIAENKATPSFTSYLMEKVGDTMDEPSLMWLSSTMYGAGTDTTVSTIQTFFLCMMLFPEAQRKAQEEIDALIGDENRLPSWEDKSDLPYIECLIKELYRWYTVLPLALPHRTTEDDEYRGYFIPKGTIVMGNAWAISQDENIYPEPEKFLPERFMPGPGGFDAGKEPLDPRQFAFGFGRRLCVGIHFAEAAIYTIVVSALATLTISKPVDKEGKEIEPSLEFTGLMISHALPFECKIQPRSEAKLALIHDLTAEGVS